MSCAARAPALPWIAAGAAGLLLVVGLVAASQSSSADISPLQTVVRGQSQWLAGGPASLRVIVTNHNDGRPVDGHVHIALTATDQQALGRRRPSTPAICTSGTLAATFPVPDLKPGRLSALRAGGHRPWHR